MRSVLALALVGSLAMGCSGARDPGEDVGRVASPIVGGTPSDESQNAVVRILIFDPSNTTTAEVCTGTLIAPDIVLTARHCVSRAEESVTCLEVGGKLVGGQTFEDRQPQNLVILVGTKPDPNATDAVGAKIFHDSATNLCGHDLALVVLDRRLASPIVPVRISAPVTVSEQFTAVGWGTDGSAFPAVRQQRTSVQVQALGPTVLDLDTGHRVAIGDNEVLVGEAGCSGDSGGPALDAATGAIIGVASRSGVGSSTPAMPCKNSKNVYTLPSGFKSIIDAAFAGSGEQLWIEGQPEPPRLPPTSPASSSSSKGCSVEGAGNGGALGIWPLTLVLVITVLRRLPESRARQRRRPPRHRVSARTRHRSAGTACPRGLSHGRSRGAP
jgi:hypothetical protein